MTKCAWKAIVVHDIEVLVDLKLKGREFESQLFPYWKEETKIETKSGQ